MFRGQPRDMAEQEAEKQRSRDVVIQNLVLFCVTVAAIRAAPFLVQLL